MERQERPGQSAPGISVIIPVYNMAPYLRDALDSLAAQTFAGWEAVCVDDGSTDGSAAILEEYARSDGRFRVCRQENAGVGPARNRGISMAAGRYLFFLDADDRVADREVFADLYRAAEDSGAAICGGSFLECSGDRVISEWKGLNAPYVFPADGMMSYRDYQFDYGWVRFLYEREFILRAGLSLPDYSYYEDPVFFVRAMDAAERFYALRRPVYCYRTGFKSRELSREKVLDLLRGVRDILTLARERGYDRLAELEKTRLREEYSARILRFAGEGDREFRALLDEIDELLYPAGDGRIEYGMYRYLLDRERARARKTEDALRTLKSSASWKLGRAATAVPRWLRERAKALPGAGAGSGDAAGNGDQGR